MQRVLSERVLVALTLLLVAAALLPAALERRDTAMGAAFDPSFFPLIILGGWIVLAALAILVELGAAVERSGPARWLRVLAASVGMLGFALLFRQWGFFIGSAVLSLLILRLAGQIGWVASVAFAVAVPGGLVALFNHVLKMPLPSSPFVWWL